MSTASSSPQQENAFTELEHKNWQRGVDAYTAGFGPLTSQAVPTLLEKAGFLSSEHNGDGGEENATTNCAPSNNLLDVACGPGQVVSAAISKAAFLHPQNEIAASKTCSYTALDFSSNFLELAKKNIQSEHPETPVSFLEGDAQNMTTLENDQFTSVTSNFGILHLSDPDSFLKESYRVLKPGGRLAFTAWSPPPQTEAFDLILGTVKDVGNPNVVLPEGPPFFRFSDPTEIQRSLKDAGFEDIDVTVVDSMEWKNVDTSENLYEILLEGTARTRELLRGQTEDETEAIREELKKRFQERVVAGETKQRSLRMPAVVSSGRKPVSTKVE